MKALLTALIKAQGDFDAVVKDAKNPHLNSKYATLGSVNEAVDGALRKNGLIVLQDARTEFDEQGRCLVYVGTSLWHAESGENVSHSLALVAPQTTPQGIGSAISYGRRYGKMTLLGLAAEDDDANSASGKQAQAQGKQEQRPQTPAKQTNGNGQQAQGNGNAPAELDAAILKRLNTVGSNFYGKDWDAKRHEAVKWATNGRTDSSKLLTAEEAEKIIGLIDKRSKELEGQHN